MSWSHLVLFAVDVPEPGATIAAYTTATGGAVAGIWKASKPVLTKIRAYLQTTIKEEAAAAAQPMVEQIADISTRVGTLEQAVAPTNGDRRSVSDRLDTVKYQTKVLHDNISILAEWLEKTTPNSPPLILHDLPER